MVTINTIYTCVKNAYNNYTNSRVFAWVSNKCNNALCAKPTLATLHYVTLPFMHMLPKLLAYTVAYSIRNAHRYNIRKHYMQRITYYISYMLQLAYAWVTTASYNI